MKIKASGGVRLWLILYWKMFLKFCYTMAAPAYVGDMLWVEGLICGIPMFGPCWDYCAALGVTLMALSGGNLVESYQLDGKMYNHTISPRSPSSSCCRSWAVGPPSSAHSSSLARSHTPLPASHTLWLAWTPGHVVVSKFSWDRVALFSYLPCGPLALTSAWFVRFLLDLFRAVLAWKIIARLEHRREDLTFLDLLAQLGICRLSLGWRHVGASWELEGPSLFGARWWWSG